MFTEKDRALHKGLMKILDEGSFTLKAREVAAFIEIYRWAKELEKPVIPNSNIKSALKKQKGLSK